MGAKKEKFIDRWVASGYEYNQAKVDAIRKDLDELIEAAVVAEQRRVWDALSVIDLSPTPLNVGRDRHFFSEGYKSGVKRALAIAFPNGEPTAEDSPEGQNALDNA